jgi:hypothetical protein
LVLAVCLAVRTTVPFSSVALSASGPNFPATMSIAACADGDAEEASWVDTVVPATSKAPWLTTTSCAGGGEDEFAARLDVLGDPPAAAELDPAADPPDPFEPFELPALLDGAPGGDELVVGVPLSADDPAFAEGPASEFEPAFGEALDEGPAFGFEPAFDEALADNPPFELELTFDDGPELGFEPAFGDAFGEGPALGFDPAFDDAFGDGPGLGFAFGGELIAGAGGGGGGGGLETPKALPLPLPPALPLPLPNAFPLPFPFAGGGAATAGGPTFVGGPALAGGPAFGGGPGTPPGAAPARSGLAKVNAAAKAVAPQARSNAAR